MDARQWGIVVVGLLGLALCSERVGAQAPSRASDTVVEALAQNVEDFLAAVGERKTPAAFDVLLVDSQLGKQRESLASLIQKTDELESKYGPLRAVERISARRLGQDVVLLKFLFKCETFPVVWRVTYYRTMSLSSSSPDRSRWIVVNVRFDTDLEKLAAEQADVEP
jgi:hypothetical protein